MRKALRLTSKQPKTIKEFWKIFTKVKEILDDNQVEFGNNVKDLKCDIKLINEKFKPIDKTVGTYTKIMVFFTAISISIAFGGLLIQKIQIDDALSENLISDVRATEEPATDETENLYKLKLHNYGEIEHNLRVTITFTLKYEIEKSFPIDEQTLRLNETIRESDTEYFVSYKEIGAGEDITIRLVVDSRESNENESLLIYPKYIKAFTDEGKIIVTRG